MRKIPGLLFLLSLLALVPGSLAQETRLNVIATTSIIADVARNVGGDLVIVDSLVPVNADEHAFQPTPADLVKVAQADLVLVNGAGLEAFLGRLVENAADVPMIVVSNGIAVLPMGAHDHDHADEDHDHADEDHDHADEEHDHADEDHDYADEAPMQGGMMMHGGSVSAAYMRISNNSGADITLIGARTDAASAVEVHETTVVDDIARMARLEEGLLIPAGGSAELRPGGLHIMLIDVQRDLIVDESLALTLLFADGREIPLAAMIRDMAPESTAVVELDGVRIEGAWARPAAGPAMPAMDAHDHDADHDHEHMHEGVEYLGVLGVDAACEDEHEHGMAMGDDAHEHEHGACDAHFWTDPLNVKVWAGNIAEAFAEADPANAETYRANAAAYQAQLDALNEEVAEILSVIPDERRVLVTNHEFLAYFALHYGFEIVGVVLPGGTTLAEPEPQQIAALVRSIEAEGVSAIFVEFSATQALAAAIAAEAGQPVQLVQLYSGALSEADGPAATYLDYMRFNARAIAEALGG